MIFLCTLMRRFLFAELDYALKNGVHIQKQSSPKGVFNFLKVHYPSLKTYYSDFFDFYLSKEGQDDEQYYFIDFRKDCNGHYNRGKIPVNRREYLRDSFIIVGFLLIRMYILEFNIDYKHSIQEFKSNIFQEFDEYKIHLLRLFTDSDSRETTDYESDTIESVIDKALRKFHELGWIVLDIEDESFQVLPSCKRLLTMYEKTISDIDQIIKQLNIEES